MMQGEAKPGFGAWLWGGFRQSGLWDALKRISFLRSGYHLAIQLWITFHEDRVSSMEAVDGDFVTNPDPYHYETNPLEQERFSRQTALLDQVRGGRSFATGLEIGCAEGLYTEVLVDRCDSLLVLDFSPTALARTKLRRDWGNRVNFQSFDLRKEAVPGSFDLIVLTGVLEYFSHPRTFSLIRRNLSAGLRPNGYLLLETTRMNPVIEDAWWSRYLVRGRWINTYLAKNPALKVVAEALTDSYAITLFQKIATGSAP